MTTALFSLFGVVIGALLQYFFTRYLESQRHLRGLKTQAYLNFLEAISGLAHLNDPLGSQECDLFAKTADAKARICIYGSKEVVHALAVFEKLGAVISSTEQRAAFVAMVSAMRNDSGNGSGPEVEDMDRVLLGNCDKLV